MRPELRPLACLLVAILATPPALADEVCPKDRTVRIDLEAWAKRTKEARTLEALQTSLAELGLDKGEVRLDPDEHVPDLVVTAADAFHANIDIAGREVRVVNVLAGAGLRSGPEPFLKPPPQLQRGAVFVAIAPGAWCRIEVPALNAQGSGTGPRLCHPTIVDFEKLVAASRDSLKLTERVGWCDSGGAYHQDSTTWTWSEVRGLALQRLLWLAGPSTSSSPAGGRDVSVRVGFSRSLPRVVTVRREECVPVEGSSDVCALRTEVERWRFDGAGYVLAPPKTR